MSSTDSRTTVTDTVITAHDVSEIQFLLLPAVLGCLRGDLGRYKASDDKARVILWLTSGRTPHRTPSPGGCDRRTSPTTSKSPTHGHRSRAARPLLKSTLKSPA